jgi:deoxyribodipyrimidine photo-lyase
MTTVIWFRRDLRTRDHAALAAAAATGPVLGLFVADPRLVNACGAPRLAFLHDCLAALNESIDGHLVIRSGDPVEVVAQVAQEAQADAVHVTRDHGPWGRRRDAAVSERLRRDGRQLRGVGSNYAIEPGTVRKDDGSPYAVFTPFFRRWLGHLEALGSPDATRGGGDVDWVNSRSEGLPARPETDIVLPPAGQDAAEQQWQRFVDGGLDRYSDRRDLPGTEGTSGLSPYLKWGAVHPLRLLADLRELGGLEPDAHRVFASELAWREFYADVLFRKPETAWSNLNPKMDAMRLDSNAEARQRFDLWCAGRTGFPIVDAGMRQLLATGWMHNRVRMIVASFLVKDLHLPWQWGAQFFMDHLIDGDLASNNHGWQWAAGTGTDAAPYFRVFNPTAQQDRYDGDGTYVTRWIPELGTDRYPPPMVDHRVERLEALDRYQSIRA